MFSPQIRLPLKESQMSNKFGHEKSNRRDVARKASRESNWSKLKAQIERTKFNTKKKKTKSVPNSKPKLKKRDESQFPNHDLHKQDDGSYVSDVYKFHQSRWNPQT